jgi:Reverse transcriptase (RNA-dependent DNA polymerase)
MRRKQQIATREVYKWKARLNVQSGKQEYGIDYWETHVATLKRSSIRFFMIQAVLNNWHITQVDFVLAYPQADIEQETYLELPPGFEIQGTKKQYCLKLFKNLYGSKSAGRVWQQHLFRGLLKLGYIQSKADPCVFFHNKTIFMVYTDDVVFIGPDNQMIEAYIMYSGCPIIWVSKAKTDIALSTTESEYSELSEAAREVLWLITLMKETKKYILKDTITAPTIRCIIFEDNEGAKALAKLPRLSPRTKHINARMHHFRDAVEQGTLEISSIGSQDQPADIGSKPFDADSFERLGMGIIVW